jgi:arylsulfatase A-like enzyme
VVVVDIDTLRADGLGCYGNRRGTSPHLDAFARRATRFAWAFAQAPYTLPSQVSIVTSLYPWAHGVWHDDDRIGRSALTVAERFRAAGFRTAAFVDGGFLKAQFGFDQGFDEFVDLDGGGLARGEPLVSAWLEAHAGERFFLFVHTYDVHSPYAPPEPFRARFAALAPAPSDGFEPTVEILEAVRASQWSGPQRRLPDADLAYARALYDGEVAFVDSWFGRFRSQLAALGIERRAVVAVVSDHGEEFQEHGSVLHEKLYATVTRVPLLVGAPDGGGSVVEETVETVDLVPTLLELAGLPGAEGLHGRSLAAVVRGTGGPLAPRPAVAMSPFYGEQRALATDDRHLILTVRSGVAELFRYRSDPLERNPVDAEESSLRGVLSAQLARRVRETRSTPAAEPAELSPEARAGLRALGYLR